MGYRCEHFILQELVGPDLFKARGERCWEMLDPALLRTIDLLRDRYGLITINDWHAGGSFKESGARDFQTTTGAVFSMHKLFKAADMKFKTDNPIAVQKDIIEHATDYPFLTCMENAAITKTWLHADTRNHNGPAQIGIVDP